MSLLGPALALALSAPAAAPAPSKPAEYSFWLVASGKEQARLRKRVARLARKLGTPAFEPHVTLIGLGALPGSDDAKMALEGETLANALSSMKVRFSGLEWQDKFFRCFYYKAELDRELAEAGELGRVMHRRLVGREPADPAYDPHLSLVYADLPAERKEKLADEEFSRSDLELSVTLDKLELWDSSASPERWRRVASWKLRPRSPGAR